MIKLESGPRVGSVAVQKIEVRYSPNYGNVVNVTFFTEIEGIPCGPCDVIALQSLTDIGESVDGFVGKVEEAIVSLLGGESKKITDDNIPEGIIKKGF